MQRCNWREIHAGTSETCPWQRDESRWELLHWEKRLLRKLGHLRTYIEPPQRDRTLGGCSLQLESPHLVRVTTGCGNGHFEARGEAAEAVTCIDQVNPCTPKPFARRRSRLQRFGLLPADPEQTQLDRTTSNECRQPYMDKLHRARRTAASPRHCPLRIVHCTMTCTRCGSCDSEGRGGTSATATCTGPKSPRRPRPIADRRSPSQRSGRPLMHCDALQGDRGSSEHSQSLSDTLNLVLGAASSRHHCRVRRGRCTVMRRWCGSCGSEAKSETN